MSICSVGGCQNPAVCRGLCNLHYHRWQRHGSPYGGEKPRAAKRQWISQNAKFMGDECLTWPFPHRKDGRPNFIVWDGEQMPASRAMCIAAHGEPSDPRLMAVHRCGYGHLGCLNPKHLEWATAEKNQNDRLRDGTDCRGQKHWNAKLTEFDVLEIRSAEKKISRRALGDRFGVSPSCIRSIQNGYTWSWL